MMHTLLVLGSMTGFNWPGYGNRIELLHATPVMAGQRANPDNYVGDPEMAAALCIILLTLREKLTDAFGLSYCLTFLETGRDQTHLNQTTSIASFWNVTTSVKKY